VTKWVLFTYWLLFYFPFERVALFMEYIIYLTYYFKNKKCIPFRFSERAEKIYQTVN
jgi:hypothetical protein